RRPGRVFVLVMPACARRWNDVKITDAKRKVSRHANPLIRGTPVKRAATAKTVPAAMYRWISAFITVPGGPCSRLAVRILPAVTQSFGQNPSRGSRHETKTDGHGQGPP